MNAPLCFSAVFPPFNQSDLNCYLFRMATSIDFKALYAEARRAAAAAKQQQGAVSQVQEPSNEITNRSWNDHDTGHVVKEIEDECVHLTPSGELAVDAFAPFRVGDVPAVYYLPNFISDAEEQRLLSAVRLASTLPSTSHSA